MRAATSCVPAQNVGVTVKSTVASKCADYVELTKPRILVMALVSVAVGFALASTGYVWQWDQLGHALLGTGLVAAASSALNQFSERLIDARMARTASRPLPAGRLSPKEVFLFGILAGGFGIAHLAVTVNLLTAGLALATLLLYTLIYTPLKQRTSLCTAVGAIPGALPPVLGWAAAAGQVDFNAFLLFAILFLWQFPHFLAIAWLYRDEYRQARLRMLPMMKPRPHVTGMMTVAYALVLLPVSLLPSRFALAGDAYFLAALVLGLGYVVCSVRFMWDESNRTARGLVMASLIYLPLLLLSLTWDHLQLLR